MKRGRVKGGSIIPATIDTGKRLRSNMAQPIRNMAGSPRGTIGGAAQNVIAITDNDLVQNGGQYKLMGGTPLPMKIVTGRRSKQGAATVVYPVDALGNYDPSFAGYIHKVLTPDAASGYDPAGLIGFWPQNELAGGVSFDHSGRDNHGAYTGVTLGQAGVPGMGMSSAGYDGLTSFNNLWSAGLVADFNGAAGTLLFFTQIDNAGIWTDGVLRIIAYFLADGNNLVQIRKQVVDNRLLWLYSAGGTQELVEKIGVFDTGYMALGITWDIAAGVNGEVKYFFNGVQEGLTDTALGVWVGNLVNNQTLLCANSTLPSNVWNAAGAPALLYSVAKTPTEMAYLSTV